jgi:malate dehydrogenase (oxaloacetate-decarboxylating)
VAVNGAGAAGTAIIELLLDVGFKDITACNRDGTIYRGKSGLSAAYQALSEKTNPRSIKGGLADAMRGADIFIGVSVPGSCTPEMVRSMNEKPVVFAMANPVPEIMPAEAHSAGAYIVGTGRSDFPNQINNVLAFPGIFRGALDARAGDITNRMKIAAAYAIANYIPDGELTPENIIPSALDKKVTAAVAAAVRGCC